jgi:RNA recognition motif-containing protein
MYLIDTPRYKAYHRVMESLDSHSALIVDGLALSLASSDLQDLFMPFGSVVWARVARDHCGHSLRYGYVVMDTKDNALKAIETLNGKTLAGLPITVSLTTAPPFPRVA